jgi:hypothetical protein
MCDDKLKRIESVESVRSKSSDAIILMMAYEHNDCFSRLFYITHTAECYNKIKRFYE